MLRYIYLEDFEIESDIVEDLFKLSHEYNLKKLNRDCEEFLKKNITVENVINWLLFAERYEAEKLRKACLVFVAKYGKKFFDETQTWRDLQFENLVDIIAFVIENSTDLASRSEVEYGKYLEFLDTKERNI